MIDEAKKSSAKERGQRFRLVRKMSGLSLEELSQKYDFGVSTIKYWECAKSNGLSSKGAKKFIIAAQQEGVQCSYMWLMHGVGLPPQFIDIRYHKGEMALVNIDHATYEEEKAIDSEIALFCEKLTGAVTLTVFDDGMEPFYSVQDIVGGRRLFGADLNKNKVVGKDCIVELPSHQLLCRRVAKGEEPGSFNLYCINSNTLANPPHHYEVKLLSAAPISRIWKRFKN